MTTTKKIIDRPRVLVLEGLSGAGECVYAAGGDPWTFRPSDIKSINDMFDAGFADALLLTGGGDVDPRRYGRRPHQKTYGVNEARDRAEFLAVKLAQKAGVPILGICRGAQVLNVVNGGTLTQHLPDVFRHAKDRHRSGMLPTNFIAGTLVHEAVGKDTARAMHLHHQCMSRVATDFRVSAFCKDNVPEAIESTDGTWRVGVQFHPEMAYRNDAVTGLFRQLVVKAAQNAGLRVPRTRLTPFEIGQRRRRAQAAKQQPAKQPAKQPTKQRPTKPTVITGRRTKGFSPVVTSWRCFRCQVDFDIRDDYTDHMYILHDVLIDNYVHP